MCFKISMQGMAQFDFEENMDIIFSDCFLIYLDLHTLGKEESPIWVFKW